MSTSYIVDLEAQTINGDHLPLPPTPIVVAPSPSRSAVPAEARNPIDDFFGYTLSQSSTSESRHDQRISAEVLPPYFEAPPAYQKKASSEPATLAMYLFRFGFCKFSLHRYLFFIVTYHRASQCSHHSGSWAHSSFYRLSVLQSLPLSC